MDPVGVRERQQPGGLARRDHLVERGGREQRLGVRVGDQVDRPEGADAADLTDAGVPLGDLGEAGVEDVAPQALGVLDTMPSSRIVLIVATAAAVASRWPE